MRRAPDSINFRISAKSFRHFVILSLSYMLLLHANDVLRIIYDIIVVLLKFKIVFMPIANLSIQCIVLFGSLVCQINGSITLVGAALRGVKSIDFFDV